MHLYGCEYGNKEIERERGGRTIVRGKDVRFAPPAVRTVTDGTYQSS